MLKATGKKMSLKEIELMNENEGNPYLRLHYVEVGLSIAAAQVASEVILVISGNNFTEDNKPDRQKNLAWCREVLPKLKGETDYIGAFEVPCEKICRKNLGGNWIMSEDGTHPQTFESVTIQQFAVYDSESSTVLPVGGEQRIITRATNLIKNSNRIFPVATAKQMFAAEKSAKQTAAAVTSNNTSISAAKETATDPDAW